LTKNRLELGLWNVVEMDFEEATLEGSRGLSGQHTAQGVLRREQHKVGMRMYNLLRFGYHQFTVVIKKTVQGFENVDGTRFSSSSTIQSPFCKAWTSSPSMKTSLPVEGSETMNQGILGRPYARDC
jgi:hypothetical protein